MQVTYLDSAATTRVDPRALEAMLPYHSEVYGNPSARHPLGVRAREAVEGARDALARALCVEREEVVFTSGGTEANNLGVLGLARAREVRGPGEAGRGHVLVGATEHASVRQATLALEREGFEVEVLPLSDDGGLDLEGAARLLRPDTVLVAAMLANNETGTVYPIRALARAVRAEAPRAAVFSDAVQAFGKLECAPGELGVDCVSLSAHKVHGPKGAGALVGPGAREALPLLYGGPQELGQRAGTENVAGIVGLGRAVELAEEARGEVHARLVRLRDQLCEALRPVPGLRVLEPGASSAAPLPSVAAVFVPGVPAEVLMHHLEERGVYVSAGAACNSNSKNASPGLMALGLDGEAARQVLRFSFSRMTDEDEVLRGAEALVEVAGALNAVAG